MGVRYNKDAEQTNGAVSLRGHLIGIVMATINNEK